MNRQPELTALPVTNKPKPQVSIGMPVYNGALFIREALDSLLGQTFTDFELIISDNASTDTTGVICQEYSKKDSRIHYIHQQVNQGPVENFAYVFSKSRGKYFMWAAHDDRWTSSYLKQAVGIMNHNEDCGLVFSNYIERDLENGDEKFHKVLASNYKSNCINYIIRTINMCPSLIYGLHRSENIANIKLMTFDFSDVHFIAEIALKSKIHVLSDYLYIAGTKGTRKPYSIVNKKINRFIFIKKQYELLEKYFSTPWVLCLLFIVCLVMIYNKIRLWRY